MALTMKNLNDRISALEDKSATTPITMKGLSDRLSNLEATAKKWIEYTLTTSGQYQIWEGTSKRSFSIPTPANLKEFASGGKMVLYEASGTTSTQGSINKYSFSVSFNASNINFQSNKSGVSKGYLNSGAKFYFIFYK